MCYVFRLRRRIRSMKVVIQTGDWLKDDGRWSDVGVSKHTDESLLMLYV